ncbi:hypothetical protein K4M64_004536 [Salmonella enterica]|nr:hypothetical protein [Salmonella enterica]
MNYLKLIKKAGEPTLAIPPHLVKLARDNLKIWQYTTLEETQARLKERIEELDRFEYLAIDDAGIIQAMMIITMFPQEDHLGHDILYTKFSFSSDEGLLTNGYRWLIELAKLMKFRFIMTTRQTGPLEITHKIHELKIT